MTDTPHPATPRRRPRLSAVPEEAGSSAGPDNVAQEYDASDASRRRGAQSGSSGPITTPEVTGQLATTFHTDITAPPRSLGPEWDHGWLVGTTVISLAVGPHTAWSARLREKLRVPGLQIARPVRSTDGRFVVAGWRASTFIPGRLRGRVDETVSAALRLADILSADQSVPRPDLTGDDAFSVADRAAWSAHPGAVDREIRSQRQCLDLLGRLRSVMRPIDAPLQVGHADMFGTTIYDGAQPPALTDLVGAVHPHGYTAAQVIVDGLLAKAVDDGVIRRFSHIRHLDQLLLRAAAYRIYAAALWGVDPEQVFARLGRVTDLVVSRASATL